MNNTVDLSVYGIENTEEVIYNPSYNFLFTEETRDTLYTEEVQQLMAAGPQME